MKKNIQFIGGSYGIGLATIKLLSKDHNLIIASKTSEEMEDLDVKRKKMGERHPLKRQGTPEDLANAGEFLIFKKSSWRTGQILGIDGGFSTLNMN